MSETGFEAKPGQDITEPLEIERKFRVGILPEGLEDFERERIRQGYMVIGSDGSEARLRDRAGTYTLTVKSKGELSRGERETELSRGQFEALWPTTRGKQVNKTRFLIPHQGHVIELDVYEDVLAGLMTAEVEFDSEVAAANFEPPEWFGEDVTANNAYKNQQLASNGVPRG